MMKQATLLVLDGDLAPTITTLATEHAAFDPVRRRVVVQNGRTVMAPAGVAALLFASDGTICDKLDHSRATSEAWIEDAFVRASRTTR